MQSDKASNYRDPTTEIDLTAIGTRCFSEAGMGKNEGDANGALNRGGMKRCRDEGSGLESAGDCLAIGESLKIPGQTHAVMKLLRDNEDSGIEGRDAVSRNYNLWVVDESTITFWEYLDEEASKLSIKATGRVSPRNGYRPRRDNGDCRVQQNTAHAAATNGEHPRICRWGRNIFALPQAAPL